MKESYRPSKREVLGEMVSGGLYSMHKNVIEPITDFLYQSIINGAMTATVLHAMPTVIRKEVGLLGGLDKEDFSRSEENGILFGVLIGLGSCIPQIKFYYDNMGDNLKIFIPIIATNVLSGLYEAGRYMYYNTEERLIERKERLSKLH